MGIMDLHMLGALESIVFVSYAARVVTSQVAMVETPEDNHRAVIQFGVWGSLF
jgi:hypothetical protein